MAKGEANPARRAIIQEWNAWALKHADDAEVGNGILFFSHLKKERPDLLLDFKSGGDKWQIVHSWLLSARKVKR